MSTSYRSSLIAVDMLISVLIQSQNVYFLQFQFHCIISVLVYSSYYCYSIIAVYEPCMCSFQLLFYVYQIRKLERTYLLVRMNSHSVLACVMNIPTMSLVDVNGPQVMQVPLSISSKHYIYCMQIAFASVVGMYGLVKTVSWLVSSPPKVGYTYRCSIPLHMLSMLMYFYAIWFWLFVFLC